MVDWLYMMTLGKDTLELIKTGATLPAQEKLVELRELLVEVRNENVELKSQIHSLQIELETARGHGSVLQHLERQGTFYVRADKPDEPFCSRCVEIDRVPVHLTKTTLLEHRRRVWTCPECNEKYVDLRSAPFPDREIKVETVPPHRR